MRAAARCSDWFFFSNRMARASLELMGNRWPGGARAQLASVCAVRRPLLEPATVICMRLRAPSAGAANQADPHRALHDIGPTRSVRSFATRGT
jgi:hypothetical protein